MTHSANLPSNLLNSPQEEVVYDLKLNNLSEVEMQTVLKTFADLQVFPCGVVVTRNAETMEILEQVPLMGGTTVQYIEILDEVTL